MCEYVAAEQARGVSILRIKKAVKDMLRTAERDATSDTPRIQIEDHDLAKQLVDWCVEFHHAAQSPAN